jgi:hypothetical protein
MIFLLYNRLSTTYLLSCFSKFLHGSGFPDPYLFRMQVSGQDSRAIFSISEQIIKLLSLHPVNEKRKNY